MKSIGVTMRVDYHGQVDERRDAIDQRWYPFLNACNLYPVLIPNCLLSLNQVLSMNLDGFLLTGGNSLEHLGGDVPERDKIEHALIDFSISNAIPVLGICRGMQIIQHHFGVSLLPVKEHVAVRHAVNFQGNLAEVNSYHHWGALNSVPDLIVDGRGEDGVIEATYHRSLPIRGIMWHPERENELSLTDLHLFKSHFNS